MDLNFTAEELAFRDEVHTFLKNELPADIANKIKSGLPVSAPDYVRWQKILHKRGWGAPGWPKQFGGPGWGPVQMHIYDEEAAAAGAPRMIPFGLKMVAPVIMAFGSPEQQKRFLPRIISADDWWCQGYSEPGAGSDLASLKTRAERQGDHY
ncbi:MAG TPA: acyl-CoA dehydrogenase family protein, partial [Nitrospiraceae bacterium]|nr:acyl-CoA dehydrogenase family protein [Nitrospiraceae bacterium]